MRLEDATAKRRDEQVNLRKAKVVTIKTVVNVVYKTAEQNISTRRSRARSRRSTRTSARPIPTRARRRRRGRDSSPTRGSVQARQVTRTKTTEDGFSTTTGSRRPATGGIAPYQPKTHLNLWVCALSGGLLGYAQFPGGPPSTDGVVINYRAFGTTGTAQAPFNKGRTATHEVGHYLNLRHIWGDTPDCSGSDMVADTPNCAGPNYGIAAVADDHVQQRSERRHVHELHGLHRRRGDVHVHRAAGAAHADGARHGTRGLM